MPGRHQRHRDAAAEFDGLVPVERFGADCIIGATHRQIIAERRDHARREFRRQV